MSRERSVFFDNMGTEFSSLVRKDQLKTLWRLTIISIYEVWR